MKKKESRLGILIITMMLAMAVIACDNGTTSGIIEKGQITYAEAKPNKGFNYGYYYYIPGNVTDAKYLLVEPNNTGDVSDDIRFHDERALGTILRQRPWAEELGVALLVPVFPRPRTNGQMYTHALDRDTLMNKTGTMARIDLQLIQMIDDFRAMCKRWDISLASKVLLNGFSGSGSFVNRFTAIHPERVQAVVSGGNSAMPIIPIATLGGESLIYPVGISDLDVITGRPFNLASYKTVPQFIFYGDADPGDQLPYPDAFSEEERQLVTRVIGANKWTRLEAAKKVHTEIGSNAIFKIYPGVGHGYTQEINQDILTFFRSNIR